MIGYILLIYLGYLVDAPFGFYAAAVFGVFLKCCAAIVDTLKDK